MKCPVGGEPVNDGRPMPCMEEMPEGIVEALQKGKLSAKQRKHLQKWATDHYQVQDEFHIQLHENFIKSHYNGSPYSDEKFKARKAYENYFGQSRKQKVKLKKKGIDPDTSIRMENGKIYAGDRELTQEEAAKLYPGIRFPKPKQRN